MPRADLKGFPESIAFRPEFLTASERDINDGFSCGDGRHLPNLKDVAPKGVILFFF